MISAPDYIQFYPTLRCNLSCDFCFNKRMPVVDDMPLADFRAMAGTLREIGVKALDIMGGEPTLHPDIIRFVESAREQGLSVNLSSNGTNTDLLSVIMKRMPEVMVGLSVNDRAGLVRMEEFIGKLRPVVKTVYGRTADHALIADILALKPRKFYLLYRDALDPSQLCETVPFDQFIEAVRKRFDPAAVGTVFCLGFLPDRETYPVLAQTRCPAGTTKLGIMPDGSVYPCNLFFGLQEFRLGNILTDPFERIWRHPALSFFRTFAGNPCSRMSCSLHSACHGGCPAHSLMLCGSVGAPDPRCG